MHCPVCHPFCTLFIVLLSVSVPYLSSLDLFGLQTKRVGTAYTLQHTLTVGVLGQVLQHKQVQRQMSCLELVQFGAASGKAGRDVLRLACSWGNRSCAGSCVSTCLPLCMPASSSAQQSPGLRHLQQAAAASSRLQHLPELQPLRPRQTLRTAVATTAAAPVHLPPFAISISRQSAGRHYCMHVPPSAPTASAAVGKAATVGALHTEEPLVVTVSWLGAKRGPFGKYKQLWQSLGYSRVLAARPPMSSIMFPLQGQLLAANFTHKLLRAAQAHPRAPILVHLFSGGGFIFMAWVFQLLAELQDTNPAAASARRRIAGVVLDSSPALVTPDVSSRALVAAVLGRPADGIEAQFPWLVRPTAAIVDGYLRLPFIRDALVGMEAAWVQQAPPCPKLFLYSESDVLIQPDVVEAFMQQQAALGSPTYSHKWSDSAHVDHFRKYPQEYTQQLRQFAQAALERWGAGGGDGAKQLDV